MTTVDAVPVPVRALAALFQEELAAVAFPDVDAASLGAALARVDEQQAELSRLEEELARARAELDAGREDLLRLATRAHAYARVYAEEEEPLRARIDAIALPRAKTKTSAAAAAPVDAPAPRRRRKAAEEAPSQLFGPAQPDSTPPTPATADEESATEGSDAAASPAAA